MNLSYASIIPLWIRETPSLDYRSIVSPYRILVISLVTSINCWSFACTSTYLVFCLHFYQPSGLFTLLDLSGFDSSISLRDFYRKVFSCNLYRVGGSGQRGQTDLCVCVRCIPRIPPRVLRVLPLPPRNPPKSVKIGPIPGLSPYQMVSRAPWLPRI